MGIAQPPRMPNSADLLDLQNEVQRVLYKLVLVTYPLDRIIILGGFTALQTAGLFKKEKKRKCVPITTIILPKINLAHYIWSFSGGPQIQLP